MICGQDSSSKTSQLSSEVTILHTTDHAGNPPMNALHSCCQVKALKLSKSNPFEMSGG